jgi:hypothetical protein
MTVLIQDLKDTFYQVLRNRVAGGNPARTVVVRGALRPGVLVVENELPGAAFDGIAPVEAFCLRWTGLSVDCQGDVPLTKAICELRYATDGSAGLSGMDRGRALAAMDQELNTALSMPPASTPKSAFAEPADGSATATPTGTHIFWGALVLSAAAMRGERMERTATIEVFGYGS